RGSGVVFPTIFSQVEEASCSICLGFFQDPVSIHCGHNFCRGCIARCWEGLEAPFSCPQCRQTAPQKTFRPSRELAKIAKIAGRLSLEAGGRGGGGGGWEKVCRQHQEVLKLFCKEDLQPICVVCDRSRAHRFHPVVPVEEAAQEYKVKPRGGRAGAPRKKPFAQGQSASPSPWGSHRRGFSGGIYPGVELHGLQGPSQPNPTQLMIPLGISSHGSVGFCGFGRVVLQ
uniref:Uncharacterized protein n=1 Tax=Calidris pygmaea TaxID=425635 RepID=A0A8C3JH44_9CHAR